MSMMPPRVLAAARLGLIAVAVSACGTGSSHLTPSASTTTLMAGLEHRFQLDWSVKPEQGDARRIHGHISSQYGEYAQAVRLLVQALDPSGNVVGQRITWVPGGISGFDRKYFESPRLPVADHYLVTVWDYTLHQSDGVLR